MTVSQIFGGLDRHAPGCHTGRDGDGRSTERIFGETRGEKRTPALSACLKSGVGGEREDSKGNFNVPAQGKAATRSFSVMLPALNMHLVTS